MPAALGIAAAFTAVLLFALFPLTTKTHASGDGLFFQLFMCLGIFTVGALLYLLQCTVLSSACPAFVPLAAVGGCIWCLSNLLLVPIVQSIGVGLCMITWGAVEMLTGWGTARFGLFGLRPQPVSSPAMNYSAVALGIVSLLVLSAAQPAVALAGAATTSTTDITPLLSSLQVEGEEEEGKAGPPAPASAPASAPAPALFPDWELTGYDFTLLLSPTGKRLFGVCACLVAGALSGSTFTPVQYIVDHRALLYPGASGSLLDHLHSHFTGILLTSVLAFAAYCGATGNRPWVSAPLALPSYASGLCWGCAMVAWFVANQNLSIVVAFPIVTLGPGLVSMAIGWRCFGEISGCRNVALLLLASCLFAAAATLLALSGGAA